MKITTANTHHKIAMASMAMAAWAMSSASAVTVTFTNQCTYTINLYDNSKTENIAVGGSTTRELSNGFSGMFRHGANDQANLVEFAVAGDRIWYDLSAIPPGSGSCKSFTECKQVTNNKSGYNVPLSIVPQTSATSSVCKTVTCEHEQCPDAYLYPTDDTKTHNCASSTPMKVVFCPSGSAATTTPAPSQTASNAFAQDADYQSGVVSAATTVPPTAAPTSKVPQKKNSKKNKKTKTPVPSTTSTSPTVSPSTTQSTPVATSSGSTSAASFPGVTVKSSFKYSGKTAGNMQGTYSMVTNTKGCVKQTVTVNSPVGPLSEEVSMVFRGPMEIYNIAVFDGSAGGDWKKVSSYSQSGETTNMVFLNNKNIDYNTGIKSPQGLASRDGLSLASTAQQFSGVLSDASNPTQVGGGPGISTGAEVNIMTSTKCSADGTCKGYYDDNGYHGWNGGKKMFVTKVKMPTGSSPNQPAIWMLNAQILRSNQYGCNCRGMGSNGGCGELDIAEVIETNSARDKVTTHYYFYDGSVAAGYDNFAARPTSGATTYLTIIDDAGEGTIKIMEIGESDFDFSVSSVAASQITTWIS